MILVEGIYLGPPLRFDESSNIFNFNNALIIAYFLQIVLIIPIFLDRVNTSLLKRF